MKMFIDVVILQSICWRSYNTEERNELKFKNLYEIIFMLI